MWGRRSNSKHSQRNLNTGEALRLAAGGGKKWRNSIFLARIAAAMLVVCAGAASAGILAWYGAKSIGQYLLYQNGIFALKSASIDCSGDVVTPKLISEYLGLNSCSNIFAFNITEERELLLKKVPRIKEARFERRLPGELIITISERQPLARLDMNSYYLTIDRDGRVLGPSSGLKGLPAVAGHGLSNVRPGVQIEQRKIARALALISACESSPSGNIVKLKTIDVSGDDSLDLTLADGEKVEFAWNDMEHDSPAARDSLACKLSQLAESLRSAAARGKTIVSIDMTVDNNFPAIER